MGKHNLDQKSEAIPDQNQSAGLIWNRHPAAPPHFWRFETSGVLAPVVLKYFESDFELTPEDISIMRAYIQQWIDSDAWDLFGDLNPELTALREKAATIESRADIAAWIHQALQIGIDPF